VSPRKRVSRKSSAIHQALGQSAIASAAEVLSRRALGDSMLTSNFAAIVAEQYVGDWQSSLKATAAVLNEINTARLAGLSRIAEFVSAQNATLIRLRPVVEIAQPAALATRAFEETLRVSSDPVGRHVGRVHAAGRLTGWTLEAGVRLTSSAESELATDREEILGPAEASTELRTRLRAIDENLCVMLDGAWERIHQGGTDAGRQAAHSLMETVDWMLRTRAPEHEVMSWSAERGPRPGDLDEKGGPTRALKFRFIVRNRTGMEKATDMYRRAVGDLVGVLQEPKHGMKPTNPWNLAPVGLTVEGLLLFIVSDDED
jgi:Predicted pPIWI-associating nuclease